MLRTLDDLLRARGAHDLTAPRVPWRSLLWTIVGGTAVFGAALGCFGGRPLQALFSALKLPLLIGCASLLCLPSFFVLNALLGLRADFPAACRAILAGQATIAAVLASFAPLTIFWYLGTEDYQSSTLANGFLCAVATLAGQGTVSRHYARLRARHPRHAIAQRAWMVIYIFVAIQMAWTLRPFLGSPGLETRLFRAEAWGNAYVELLSRLFRVEVR